MKEKLDQFEIETKDNINVADNHSHVNDKSDVESHKSGTVNKTIDIEQHIDK
eukprot:CAMPEP_0176362848 /NCGR_PEP_ID=MMETSP0126-20121128/18708_1 /TAXON_ID=141414 ORGANISM="Strombidinopsis acuminatum, Strain SPMC142" /NCGR_SAMPLE_ID=MMETSP0126 /ASSEMBLY_ACC=CAM_ASM_000229 /LENGTH=51 /DNA_ID=CAMNT_0017718915 /DNA_START=944 /DNA_END=1099 /DNA_ORIENTATION=-